MKEEFLLTVFSEDKKGLVSILTSMLNRKGIEMKSINAAQTDIHTQILIDIEVIAEPSEIKLMALKIKNIIEVYKVSFCLIRDAWYQKIALYTLEKSGYNSDVHKKLQKFGADIVGYINDAVIIQKLGRDDDILQLYNELEGPSLKGFSKSSAISLNPFNGEQSLVISMAA